MRHAASARGGSLTSDPLRVASSALFCCVLAAWFFFLAPTTIGGRDTYALVHGHSMEPLFYTGTLVIARAEPSYSVGDLVVYRAIGGGHIVHRIVSGSASTGWRTQGDNNGWVDPWNVPDDTIDGRYWADIPHVGDALNAFPSDPLVHSSAFASLALVCFLPLRRRRLHRVLRRALARSTREPRRPAGSRVDHALFAGACLATLASAGALGLVGAADRLATASGISTAIGLAASGAVAVMFARRLFDGHGRPEPARSLAALAGRLHAVDELPEPPGPVTNLSSAVALRAVAEEHRLPILHALSPLTGRHVFLVITARRGSYVWRPGASGSRASRGDRFPRAQASAASCPAPVSPAAWDAGRRFEAGVGVRAPRRYTPGSIPAGSAPEGRRTLQAAGPARASAPEGAPSGPGSRGVQGVRAIDPGPTGGSRAVPGPLPTHRRRPTRGARAVAGAQGARGVR